MPSTINDHLEWIEVTDFSAGLHTADSAFLMPAEGFQTMTDCEPREGGGLRAWFKRQTLTSTGLPASGEKAIALHRQLRVTAGLIYDEFVLATTVVSTGVCKIYHRASGGTSWSLIKTFTAPPLGSASPTACQIINYTQSTNYLFVFAMFSYGGTWADEGIWTYNPATTTWAQISSTIDHGIAVYQNRLLGCDGSILWWTDPDAVTFPAANYIDLQDNVLGGVSNVIGGLITQGPSTLILSSASGWVSIEGSLDDPVIREMGRNHVTDGFHNGVAHFEDTAFFSEGEHGLWQVQNMGNTFTRIDQQIEPIAGASLNGNHGMAVSDEHLFTPEGRIFIPKMGAWFTESYGAAHHTQNFFSDGQNTVYMVDWEAPFTITYIDNREVSGQRLESFTVKTAPLRHPDGHQVNIRQVNVMVKSFNSAATVAVTVNGTTVTSSALGTGVNVIPFLFNQRGEYLDVTVTSASNVTNTEAPVVEGFKIGYRPDGHRLR